MDYLHIDKKDRKKLMKNLNRFKTKEEIGDLPALHITREQPYMAVIITQNHVTDLDNMDCYKIDNAFARWFIEITSKYNETENWIEIFKYARYKGDF
jgi:hypothetical protein